MDHNNLEIFLYKVIEEISKENAPIIFKGGLALKDILKRINSQQSVERKTTDIDGNWVGDVDYDQITEVIEKAVKRVNSNFHVELKRIPGENKSIGYKIFNEKNMPVTKIDLDVKDNPFYIILNINDVDIKYSSLEKIFADKLFVLSDIHVFRRIKDLLDVYLILKQSNMNMIKVKEILDFDKRELGDFSTLLQNKKQAKQSYDMLAGIEEKPAFEDVWKEVIDFLIANHLIVREETFEI